jgi:hypothetical protein
LRSCHTGAGITPFTENYSKSDYHSDNQIWNVVQGQDKAMYFANNHYFLRYDGVKWEKNTLPNQTIIRSVLAVHDRVYCGSYKEFGYWYRKDGVCVYLFLETGSCLVTMAMKKYGRYCWWAAKCISNRSMRFTFMSKHNCKNQAAFPDFVLF